MGGSQAGVEAANVNRAGHRGTSVGGPRSGPNPWDTAGVTEGLNADYNSSGFRQDELASTLTPAANFPAFNPTQFALNRNLIVGFDTPESTNAQCGADVGGPLPGVVIFSAVNVAEIAPHVAIANSSVE